MEGRTRNRKKSSNNMLIIIIVLVVCGTVAFFFMTAKKSELKPNPNQDTSKIDGFLMPGMTGKPVSDTPETVTTPIPEKKEPDEMKEKPAPPVQVTEKPAEKPVPPAPSPSRKPAEPQWFEWTPSYLQTPVDVSFINEKPAGQHGFLTAKDGEFVFEDGTPIRFWGLSCSLRGNAPKKENAEAVAKTISKRGFNLVRLHHLDARFVPPPKGLFDYREKKTTRELDPECMERLDFFISCLKKEGVYVFFDMFVCRNFQKNDGYPNADKIKDGHKIYGCFVPKLIELQKEFMTQIWTHKNPHTGLEYRNDPVFVGTEIMNEVDSFNLKAMYDWDVQPEDGMYKKMLQDFAKENGYTYGQVQDIWGKEGGRRFCDYFFTKFFSEMRDHLRSIGMKTPVTSSNWLRRSTELTYQAKFDFTDCHRYTGKPELGLNPFTNSTTFARAATSHVYNKPLAISEWNPHSKNPERGHMMIGMAAMTAFQQWDAPMCFTYATEDTYRTELSSKYSLEFGNDPSRISLMHHAGLMVIRGDVSPAKETIAIHLPDEYLYGAKMFSVKGEFMEKGEGTMAYRTGVEKHRIVGALHNAPPEGNVDRIVKPEESFIPAGSEEVESDTGEIKRNWIKSVQFIDTPRTQVAQGALGRYGTADLSDIAVNCSNGFAVIAVSSLTDDPISKSSRVLITAVGNSKNKNPRAKRGRQGPILAEGIEADITLKGRNKTLTVVPLYLDLSKGNPLPALETDTGLKFTISGTHKTLYYLITAE